MTAILTVATVILAVATVCLVVETRRLANISQPPHIAVHDVMLEVLDETGTVQKRRTWLNGEQKNEGAGTRPASEASLVIQFVNTGKESAYVRLTNADGLLQELTGSTTSRYPLSDKIYLVPGNGRTGWLYPLPFHILIGTEQNVDVRATYAFDIYDSEKNPLSTFETEISCVSTVTAQATIDEQNASYVNILCSPSGTLIQKEEKVLNHGLFRLLLSSSLQSLKPLPLVFLFIEMTSIIVKSTKI